MPLSGSTWGQAAAAAAAGVGIQAGTPVTEAQLVAFWTAIKTVDTTQITTVAKVAAGIPVSTTGGPAAQTGATTSVGTIV